jgi:hypothetical protein
MRDNVDAVVIFPRWTVFVGTDPTYSGPMDVRAYGKAFLVAGMRTGMGATAATVAFTVQTSPDLAHWVDGGSLAPAADGEDTEEDDLPYAWLRVKAVVTGSDPVVAGFLVADLVRRDVGEEAA